MPVQQAGDLIGVDPDLAVLLVLGEDELNAEMEVDHVDVFDVLLVRAARAAHEAQHLARLHRLALRQTRRIGRVLLEMGIIVIALPVRRADTDMPAAVAVPAQGLDGPALHGDDGRPGGAHHVVAQVWTATAVAPGRAEVRPVGVGPARGDGRKGLDAPGGLPFAVHPHGIAPREAAQHRAVGLPVVAEGRVVSAQQRPGRCSALQTVVGRDDVPG